LVDSADELNPANASVSGAAGGASYSASASVVGQVDGDVKLRVHAKALAPPVINEQTFLYRAGASASATWTDTLTLSGLSTLPEPYNKLVNGLSITTSPNIHGSISGPNYTYRFGTNAALTQDEHFDFASYSTTQTQLNGQIVTDQTFGVLPLTLFGTPNPTFDTLQIDFYISIDVDVTSHPGDGPSSGLAEADYSQTVTVGSFIIADKDGKYIPGSEMLQLVGESGVAYRLQPVPEPTAGIIAILGVLSLLTRGRARAPK
jgi:hypothetical protein